MPLEQFVSLFECIAEVVQAAHERGIVHGGLKPSNIMVMKGSDRLFPKLLGFGIDRLTRSDAGMDSPAYMAPEQRRSGDTVGRAADIYALGVIAYEALTGHVPIAAEPLDEGDGHRRDVPVPPLGGDFSAPTGHSSSAAAAGPRDGPVGEELRDRHVRVRSGNRRFAVRENPATFVTECRYHNGHAARFRILPSSLRSHHRRHHD